MDKKTVLNAGCGFINLLENPYAEDKFNGWNVTRMDINEETKPDILSDICDMESVKDNTFDAIWSQHTLEHLFTADVDKALNEFFRVIKPGGFVAMYLPDFKKIAEIVIEEPDVEKVQYVSTGGCIRTVDMVFGYEQAIRSGQDKMLHKTCFTEFSIIKKLEKAGFVNVNFLFDRWDFFVTAYKIG